MRRCKNGVVTRATLCTAQWRLDALLETVLELLPNLASNTVSSARTRRDPNSNYNLNAKVYLS